MAWRRGALRGVVAAVLVVPWTLWMAEGLVRLLPDATASLPSTAPRWHADALAPVDGHDTPRAFASRPLEAPTVVVLGDSFAAGQGVLPEEAFPALLQDALRRQEPAVRVVRLARPSRSLWDEVVLHGTLGSRLNPGVVIWTVVLNDVGLPGQPDGADLVTRSEVPSSGSLLIDRVGRIVEARSVERRTEALYRQAWSPDRAEWRDARARLQQLVRAEEARGTRVIVAIFPLLHRLGAYPFHAAHEAIAEATRQAGGEVVDLLEVFEGEDAATLWASRADHHPNARAHAMAAEALLGAIRSDTWAGPVGPAPCEELPSLPGVEAAQRQACRSGEPADLLALGHALIAFDAYDAELGIIPEVATGAVAADLAVVASAWDPLVKADAITVVQRARGQTP